MDQTTSGPFAKTVMCPHDDVRAVAGCSGLLELVSQFLNVFDNNFDAQIGREFVGDCLQQFLIAAVLPDDDLAFFQCENTGCGGRQEGGQSGGFECGLHFGSPPIDECGSQARAFFFASAIEMFGKAAASVSR